MGYFVKVKVAFMSSILSGFKLKVGDFSLQVLFFQLHSYMVGLHSSYNQDEIVLVPTSTVASFTPRQH